MHPSDTSMNQDLVSIMHLNLSVFDLRPNQARKSIIVVMQATAHNYGVDNPAPSRRYIVH